MVSVPSTSRVMVFPVSVFTKIACLRAGGALGGGWTPSGCCSPGGYGHPRAAYREDETLLIRGDALLVLDLGLDGLDGVGALNLESDGLSGECLHEDLHASAQAEH